MSAESKPKKTKFEKGLEVASGLGKVARTGLAVVGGLTLAGSAAERITGPAADKVADEKITQKVAMDQPVSVLEGGKAVIDLGNGRRAVVTNPLIEKDAVAERTTGHKSGSDLVTAYEPDSEFQKVTYTKDGVKLSQEQAEQAASRALVNVQPETGAIVISEGQVNAGELVGESVHQHKETTTRYVNNN